MTWGDHVTDAEYGEQGTPGLIGATLFPLAVSVSDTVLEGLDYPWDIEAHGGLFYITEKAGTLGLFDGTSFARLPIITSARSWTIAAVA